MSLPVLFGSAAGGLYAILCLAFGSRLLIASERWLSRDPPLESTARASAAFALGHVVFGTVWLIVSLAGSLTRPVVVLLGGFLLVACLGACRDTLRGLLQAASGGTWTARPSWIERMLLGLLVCVTGLLLVRALLPPMVDDPLQIYLVTPKVVAATGRLEFQPFNYHLVYPLLTEMNQAAVLSVANETAATTLDGFVGVNLLLSLVALALEVGVGKTGALLAPLVALTGSAFTGVIGSCKVDISVAMFAALAMVFGFRARHGRPGDLALAGVFLGAALATKYTSIILLPGLVVILLVSRLRRAGGGAFMSIRRTALPVALGSLAVFLPQMIKNVLLVGNPVAPFLSDLFGTSKTYWTKLMAAEYWEHMSRLSGLKLWAWPFTFTFVPQSNMLGSISPLYLGLLPALAWIGFAQKRQRSLALAAIVMLLAWTAIDARAITPRFVFAPLVALAVVAAGAGERLLERPIVRPALLLCLAGLSLLMLFGMRDVVYAARYACGFDTRSSIYRSQMQQKFHYAVAQYLNEHNRPGTRVFLEGLEYPYFLDTDILLRSQSAAEMQRASEGCAARDAAIREGGFSHVVVRTDLLEGGFSYLIARTDPKVCDDPEGFEVAFRSGPILVLRATSSAHEDRR